MKFEKISAENINEILKNQYQIDVNLQDLHFCRFELNNTIYYSYLRSEVFLDEFASGRIILENSQGKWKLYPSIMDILLGIPRILLSDQTSITKITHGQSIKITSDDSLVLIEDNHSSLIAMGYISQNTFSPITDIGFYLRAE